MNVMHYQASMATGRVDEGAGSLRPYADTLAPPAEEVAGARLDTVLSVQNLRVTFNTEAGLLTVVDGVSFDIQAGKTVALVGESGSGKSVTSLAVMGLHDPSRTTIGGAIRLLDKKGAYLDLNAASERQLRGLRGDCMSMIFQEPMTSLNPVHTVGEQIGEALLIHRRMPRRDREAAVIRMLDQVGIPDPVRRARAYPHELSGGMRQRVMIAMALICNPSLLIADEPTTALDVTIQAQILSDLESLQEKFGMAVLFVTHDLGVVAEFADSVVIMYAGQVVETGLVKDILTRPRHPYTRALLESIPSASADRSRPLPAISGTVPDLGNLPSGCRFNTRCRHSEAGRCDSVAPALLPTGQSASVRCIKWQELAV